MLQSFMKNRTLIAALAALLPLGLNLDAANLPEAFLEASEQRRKEIPLGGDLKPAPEVPVLVAVGHGARILLSRDDGATWEQVFWGYPGSDHGAWACKSVAYTKGVFAVAVGWTKPATYLASEDGVHWRHLTDGKTPLGNRDDPSIMPVTGTLAAGKGVFIGSGYTTFTATPDLGKTWSTFSIRAFKDDPRGRLSTHHVKTIYCGDASGRFLALGDDRSKENPGFGNLFASDDLGQTWTWLDPKGLDSMEKRGGVVSNGKALVMIDRTGAKAYRSADWGETWEGPFTTGAGRGAKLSMVNGEFWLAGSPARASKDGETWRELPEGVPSGLIVATDTATLVNVDRQRFTILRSTDQGASWTEVFAFEPETEHVHGAQGLSDIAFGYVTEKPLPR